MRRVGGTAFTVVMTYRPGTVKRELGQLVMEEQQRHHEAELKSAAVD